MGQCIFLYKHDDLAILSHDLLIYLLLYCLKLNKILYLYKFCNKNFKSIAYRYKKKFDFDAYLMYYLSYSWAQVE